MRLIVCANNPTTPAAKNAVSRFSCSHGWRNARLLGHGVASRSSFCTPTIEPGWALNSNACCWKSVSPRITPTRRSLSSHTGYDG